MKLSLILVLFILYFPLLFLLDLVDYQDEQENPQLRRKEWKQFCRLTSLLLFNRGIWSYKW